LGARFLNAENRNIELLSYEVEIELEHDALSLGQVPTSVAFEKDAGEGKNAHVIPPVLKRQQRCGLHDYLLAFRGDLTLGHPRRANYSQHIAALAQDRNCDASSGIYGLCPGFDRTALVCLQIAGLNRHPSYLRQASHSFSMGNECDSRHYRRRKIQGRCKIQIVSPLFVDTSSNCAEFLKELLEPLLVRGILAVHVGGTYYRPFLETGNKLSSPVQRYRAQRPIRIGLSRPLLSRS
jgi:hypothetical protein